MYRFWQWHFDMPNMKWWTEMNFENICSNVKWKYNIQEEWIILIKTQMQKINFQGWVVVHLCFSMEYLLFYIWYVMDFYVDQSLPNENSLDYIRNPIIVNIFWKVFSKRLNQCLLGLFLTHKVTYRMKSCLLSV